LGEIETALLEHPAVQSCVVIAAGNPKGNKRLVAYVVPSPEQNRELVPDLPANGDVPDYEAPPHRNWALDPIERLKFKLSRPGLRKSKDTTSFVQLSKPKLDDRGLIPFLQRRSYRSFAPGPVTFRQMSQFLQCLLGVELDRVPLPKYQYGSAGSLYPVQTYLYIKPDGVEGIAGGIYYYHPREHRLVLISENVQIYGGLYGPNEKIFDAASFAIFMVAARGAIEPLYAKWAREFCLIEAGLITQLMEMWAPEQNLGLCQIGGFDFDAIRHEFGLAENDLYLHSLLGGVIYPEQTQLSALQAEADDIQFLYELTQKQAGERVRNGAAAPAFVMPNPRQHEVSLLDALPAFLRQKLPDYMVPTAFVMMEKLPLTSNGKVDRRSLPEADVVEAHTTPTFVAPQTELGQTIAAIWQQIVGVTQVGIHDNFFDIGGDSVQLVQVYNKLCEVMEIDISIVQLFEHPTIHSLMTFIDQKGSPQAVTKKESEERAEARRVSRRIRHNRP
jgi:SagB-type dehydrogenase family enzyme